MKQEPTCPKCGGCDFEAELKELDVTNTKAVMIEVFMVFCSSCGCTVGIARKQPKTAK